jgi:hypothetical protein
MSDVKSVKPRPKRYAVSVSGSTYARVRASVASVSTQKFVDGLIVSALDDPTICARVLEKCQAQDLA